MTDWIKHDGKGMPVDGETLVNVEQRDGWKGKRPVKAKLWRAGHDNWKHGSKSKAIYDIIAYRVHTPSSEVAA